MSAISSSASKSIWLGTSDCCRVRLAQSSENKRLSSAREEADAFVWYFARHCPGEPDENAINAYSRLVRARSAAHAKPGEDSYHSPMAAYQALACHAFRSQEVHGGSILDSIRKRKRWSEWIVDKRSRPGGAGHFLFGSALLLKLLDTWSIPESRPASRGPRKSAPSRQAAQLGNGAQPFSLPAYPCLCRLPGAQLVPAPRWRSGSRLDRLTAMSSEENRMHGLLAGIFLGAALRSSRRSSCLSKDPLAQAVQWQRPMARATVRPNRWHVSGRPLSPARLGCV